MVPSELEAEWHPTLNLPLLFNLSLTISRKYWWSGKCAHEWQATLDKRQRGGGCPYCSGYRVLSGFNDLLTTHSELASEWHPTKNGDLTPQQVNFGSDKKVWWLGKCGHEWEVAIKGRARRNNGCPICIGRQVLAGFNDLATVNPTVASEWHPIKNGARYPHNVTVKSKLRVWWICSNNSDHEWETLLSNRTKKNGTGCPVCALGRIKTPIPANQLNLVNSPFLTEWHPVKNGTLVPSAIKTKRLPKVWWLGKCGHEWEATLGLRRKGVGCPICAGQKVVSSINDLSTTHPEIASEWHPIRNSELSVSSMTIGSHKKVWWLGKCGHEWEATPNARSSGASGSSGYGCPVCAGRKILIGFNDLASLRPDLAAEWHPYRNNDVSPQQVTNGSNRKVWWLGKCGHEWKAAVSVRSNKDHGCLVCSGFEIVVGFNDFATFHPKAASEWHPTKNGELTPQQVTVGSRKKIWWLCSKGHEWETTVSVRSGGSGCSVCAGRTIIVGSNDFATINPALAAEWHPTKNGNLTPQQVTISSSKKVWWMCSLGHEWKTILSGRTAQEYSCPTCSNQRLLIGFNDFATKNPLLVSEWHPTKNGTLKPSEILAGSNEKAWWLCSKNHEWTARVRGRSAGYGCPTCTHPTSKAEIQIKEFIEGLGLIAESSNRTLLGGKEIDLWIPEKNVGIEFNGIYWHKEKFAGTTSHYDKWLAARKAGIQLIQIWEDDWTAKPEVVKNVFKQKLGVTAKVLAEETDVISVTKEQAEEFLSENHLQGYASWSYYLGLVSKGDIETLRAVMVLNEESGNALNIVCYATSANVVDGFSKTLSPAKETFQPESFTVTADHCMSDKELYENNGFTVEKVLSPDYMYVVKNERKPRSEYPLERFRDDPKLLWEEGLTERELADLNGLDRIWDAGKTLYRLVVGK